MPYRSLLLPILDLIDGFVAIVDPEGQLLAATDEMRAQLVELKSCRLDRSGRLSLSDPALNRKFREALAEVSATSDRSNPAIFSIGSGAGVLTLILHPVPPLQSDDRQAAEVHDILLILCGSRRRETISDDLLKAHYRLTTAEAAIARLIASGKSVEEAAKTLSVTVTTARNQLSAAKTKMGVRRQAELVTAVASLSPRLRLKGVPQAKTPSRATKMPPPTFVNEN